MKDIEADKALVKIEEDALGVSGLAKRVAANIVKMTPREGLVIGLYGKWGSGKTTFINFVKQAITDFKKDEQPLILHFNPWLFAGHEDLIQRYLVDLSRLLNPDEQKSKDRRKVLIEKAEEVAFVSEQLIKFAAFLSGHPLAVKGVKVVGDLSKRALKDISKGKPLSEQKSVIEESLKKINKKILVIIDDIDRLEAKEVLDIFRMVKSVADFPNVIYLLSLDKEMISRIVEGFQNIDANEYLEKIIQYEVNIPPTEHSGMLTLFGNRINDSIDAPGGKKWNIERWTKLYRDFLKDKIRTPRQAVRLSNSFNISYPALRGEVDPVDFLAVEALRMFHDSIYYEISRYPEKFVEHREGAIDEEAEKAREKAYFEKIINSVVGPDRKAIKSILELLFPRIDKALNRFAGDGDISELRGNARISSSHHFYRYFSYSIMNNQFSDAEINEAIALTGHLEEFEKLLSNYSKQIVRDEKSRIPEFLERILDAIKSGNANAHLKQIISAFIIFGDLVVRKEDEDRGGFVRISTDLRVLWIITAAMEKLAETQDVFDTLKQSFSSTKSIQTPLKLLFYLGHEHGLYKKEKENIRKGEPPYLSVEQVKEIKSMFLPKIDDAGNDGRLLNSPGMSSNLFRWRDITGNFEKPKSWAEKITVTDEGLKKFLIGMSGISVRTTSRGTEHILYVSDTDVAHFLDLKKTHAHAKRILNEGKANKEEGPVLEKFIEACEEKFKEDDRKAMLALMSNDKK